MCQALLLYEKEIQEGGSVDLKELPICVSINPVK